MSNMVCSFSCRCLNVRFYSVGGEVSRVVVTHPRLIDTFLDVGPGEESRIHLACFLCGVFLFDCSWSLDRLDNRRTALEFRHAAFESVTILGNRVNLRTTGGCLTDQQRLAATNSPAFSSTFRVLLSDDLFIPPPAHSQEMLLLDIYPEQLLQLIADLCDVVFKRDLRLRTDLLMHQHHDIETQGDLAQEERNMRSEFQILCKLLWDRHYKDVSPANDISFNDSIQPYLARIDAGFRECIAIRIPNVPATVDSDLVAMILEGLSSDRLNGVQPQAPFKSPNDPGATFSSLPTETVWKIFHFLRPRYFAIDLLSAKKYCVECSSFAQLLLVSKSWSEMVLPVLYHTVVLLANPDSLNKLGAALRSHGAFVRTIIVDDVGLGPDHADVHIQTCWRYIDKCFEFSTNVFRVECYGDYQVELHDFSKSGSHNQIHTLILRLPLWLPFNISRTLTLSSSNLEHLEISQWQAHSLQPALDPKTCPPLPKCRTIDLRHSSIGDGEVAGLLSLAAVDGKSSLRSLSIVDMVSLHCTAIISLLRINEISTHLTTLRIQLAQIFQCDDGNDFPLQVLPLCPSLAEFSYTSPSSVEVFQYLPLSLRALELAVIPPQVYAASLTPVPSTSSVEPFITYIASDRASKLERLSVVRRVYSNPGNIPARWIRFDTQHWDDHGELRALCKRRHVQFDCAFFALV